MSRELSIERYNPGLREEWDAFVEKSRNATFLHLRGFMDYHSDRYADHSLIARRGGEIVALLPANISGGVLYSHQGLTYGGWLLPPSHFESYDMLALMRELKGYCRREGMTGLEYKPVPGIYASQPSDEDLYALWRAGASLIRRDLSVTVDLEHNEGYDSQQRRNLKRAQRCGLEVRELTEDVEVEAFHRLLSDCLGARHAVAPVHTLDELKLLRSRFPDRIRLYGVAEAGSSFAESPSAGVCMFDCGVTSHAQYICSAPSGRRDGALALLFDYLIRVCHERGVRYFDFGICNEDNGRYLNEGLARQKYGLGGRATIYERYYLDFSKNDSAYGG